MRMTEQDLAELQRRNPQLRAQNAPKSVSTKVEGSVVPKQNKFHAVRTYSELCGRTFDSKAEARRGEELYWMEKAGEIRCLDYQVKFVLCKKPIIRVTIDFTYLKKGKWMLEDCKGVLTRDSRTRYAWLEQLHGIHVNLIR